MSRLGLLAILATLASAGVQAAAVYRCTDSGGAVTYQELPCSAGAAERTWEVSFPPANTTERERLLQREAALDARMLKRAELDTAERIAREARYAQEAALEAERERAKATESPYFYPVYARPVRYAVPRSPQHPIARPPVTTPRF
jgi:hypothetical protein